MAVPHRLFWLGHPSCLNCSFQDLSFGGGGGGGETFFFFLKKKVLYVLRESSEN